ncbi:putative short-chain dehydrogenase [Setomelanomma holmii]|uniref:Short-chain dehydrogenase n=1 Tax=Setomelanomma holmii TaxID=210430 RepID=A0A9P4GZD5_9PLEO|nr:putative short-chain dehydrogenase [Setomelanomma holmii]
MSKHPVVLILGAGPNVGQHVSRAFAARGYKVALASRSVKNKDSPSDQVNLQVDLSNPSSIPELFAQVKDQLGLPSVVVYNAGAATPNEPNNSFSLSLADFVKDLNINTISVFAAAQQAALAFSQLPESAGKTFIYTGNVLNTNTIIAPLMSLGVGKSATAHMIQSAAAAYASQGFKFYYADERKEDGSAAYADINGEAHGKHYVELAEGKEQGPWQQTFVGGKGYTPF